MKSKIDFSALRPVRLTDRSLFEQKIALMNSQSCECSFVNLFVYQKPYKIEFLEWKDRIVVYERVSRTIHYPLGKWTDPEELREIADAFMAEGLIDGGIYDVPEEFLDRHGDCDKYFDIEFDEGMIDYLFSVEKIATFVGPKLRKKHNLVKQFQSNWPTASVKKITAEEIPVAAKLATELNSRLTPCEFLDEEAIALEQTWKNFSKLGLFGIILYAEPDFPAGFSVYSILPSDTVDVHFEKADHSVKGASQTLTWQLAIALRGKAAFMNREQDMNEESLRHAKRSLDPERFFKRYFFRRRV
ncbi:MAG: DUF2156 domain-containing protein [Lentisphaeria bacterium]|nr:DUF2156 domain-containing protein [Lentisphaeria bacterium]